MSLYVVLVLIGSDMLSMVGSIASFNIQPLMWMINILIAGLAMIIITKGIVKNYKVFNIGWPFFIYFSMFLIRMVFDLYFREVEISTSYSRTSYLIYFLGLSFLFSYSFCYIKEIDFSFLSKTFYISLFMLLCLSIVYNSVLKLDEASTLRSHGAANIGALSYGQLGVSFFLMSLHYFTIKQKNIYKLLYIGGMALGLLIVFLASSRSPLVSLILCTITYLLIQRGAIKGLFIFLLLSLPIYFFWDDILILMSNFHSSFIQRVLSALEGGDSSGRDIIFAQGLKQFKENPIFGSSFLIEQGIFRGIYPHNLILESLMATGLIGTYCLFRWLFGLFKTAYTIISSKDKYAWIPLLFFQYFVFGMFSKSIYANTSLWYFAFLLMYLSTIKKRKSYAE